ncbi:LLM class flavin-dependent oxidoreductase [Nonomuraea sp. NPDC052116]|uniref:LLM class flavin-dependent oxidoreductase n=1 Tax=Nonomuraea sp. NPDC052116 TaxID=3155665 RepID=UPI0034137BE3
MRAGVVVTAHPGVEDLAVQAEELGLHSFWLNDTPMVHGDPFVALGLCAKATSRIRLGIGVTSPALRSAPAAASAFASLNALAPGRIICGIGTGNTARRTLGMRPTTAATMENFTAALQNLCAGRTIEYREGDRVRNVRFLHTGAHANTADPIEFVVAALGPKAAADTAADARAFADQLGPGEREAVRRLLDRRGTTATAPDRHTKLYPNYLERIAPEDRDLILPSLMNTLALVGTRHDLRARITTLEQAGIDELLIQPVIDPPTEMAQLAKLLT